MSDPKPAEAQVIPDDLIDWRLHLSEGEDSMSIAEEEALLDRCIEAEQRIARLKEALRNIWKSSPVLTSCESFHHAKSDQHECDADCPIEERWHVARNAAGATLAATEGETQ